MPIIGTSRFTERIKFFNGQRLFASDLQDLEQFNREMRWLHNQSLHQAGIASGYAVSGNKDDRVVTIQPGYAIDNSGREIVLTQPEALQVPPVANDGQGNPVYYDLTVSYPDDSLLKETETRDGICVSRSAVRLREKPVFCWVELGPPTNFSGSNPLAAERPPKFNATLGQELQTGVRIRLARAEVLNCRLNQPLWLSQRRNAKPAMQPFLWADRTQTKNNWDLVVKGGIQIALRVDTLSGHFRTPPRYFAHAIGNRVVKVEIKGQDKEMVLDGFVRLYRFSDESAPLYKDTEKDDKLGFTFSMLIPAILIDPVKPEDVKPDKLNAALENWYVEWLGIEG